MRVLCHLLTLASLLAAIASVLLWIRTIWYVDLVFQLSGPLHLSSYHGRLSVRWEKIPVQSGGTEADTAARWVHSGLRRDSHVMHGNTIDELMTWAESDDNQPRENIRFQFIGFHFYYQATQTQIAPRFDPLWEVRIPYWMLLLATLLWPTWRLAVWWRQRRRRQRGQCLQCGYDLRGSGNACPECGATSLASNSATLHGSIDPTPKTDR